MNTDKICLFTDKGNMHTVKVVDLPFGKLRDKGIPVDNVSNYNSTEEQIIFVAPLKTLNDKYLIFTTKYGMMKKVLGTEFEVSKRTIAATKLNEGDEISTILTEPLLLISEGMSVSEIPKNTNNIVLQTKNGIFLRFASIEIPEKKRGAVGVRAIKLVGADEVEQAYIFDENETYTIKYNKKEVTLSRLKKAGRDTKGSKYRG